MLRALSGDRLFLIITIALALGGFAIFASASLGLLARQSASVSKDILMQASLGLGLGFLALLTARTVPLRYFKDWAPWIYAGTLLFTALVFVPHVGARANGATRWIDVGFTTIQPAEFLKIGAVIMLAWWISNEAKHFKDANIVKGFLPFLGIIGLPAILLLLQPNTSTTLLIAATGTVMYFAAGAPLRDFLYLFILGVVVLGVVLLFRPYAVKRVLTFIDPASDPLNSSYQIQQSLIAVGSGGLLGRGFGQSIEKFNYLPEPDGDSVFAVFAEETGLVGSLLLLGLFLALSARGIVIAGESRELFGGLLALGFSFLLAFQAFVNMSAMLGIVPLTGLPLPFVSHGGTALLAALAMCGFILNVGAHRKAVA